MFPGIPLGLFSATICGVPPGIFSGFFFPEISPRNFLTIVFIGFLQEFIPQFFSKDFPVLLTESLAGLLSETLL